MSGLRRCPQCYKPRNPAGFLSDKPGAMCADCRGRLRAGTFIRTPEERRARLRSSPDRLPRVRVVAGSGNTKLGGLPSTMSTAETCPDACALKGAGCYAEFHVLGHHWAKTADVGLSWPVFLAWVLALPDGTVWRHNTAGDLPGAGDELDAQALEELAAAATAGWSRGFTFTHKPLRRAEEREAVAASNAVGFTVNLSADSLEDADRLQRLGVGPVAALVAGGTKTGDRTRAGQRVVVCPAQLHDDVTCATCLLCSRADRAGVVGFIPHGQMGGQVARRLPVINAGAT